MINTPLLGIALIGIGLIGSSISLAVRKNNLAGHIAVSTRSADTLDEAQARGVVINHSLLSEYLALPVVPTTAIRGLGVEASNTLIIVQKGNVYDTITVSSAGRLMR